LRRALAEGELLMHYQPLLRLRDRVWDRAETLVRSQHPTRDLIGPGEFIPLAEQRGLMGALGERVLELVIAQAKIWSRTLPGVQLSVNVSGMQPGLLQHRRASETTRGRAPSSRRWRRSCVLTIC
jgi:EAL domain-containing protein (putative c-di-GMP-specific phosphodiesterase class I)